MDSLQKLVIKLIEGAALFEHLLLLKPFQDF